MEMNVNEITIKHCNNISFAKIQFSYNCLNIKFAANGTGKSTIAKAIYGKANNSDLSDLRSFGSDDTPDVTTDYPLGKVYIFDEDFVNSIVFRESEVIQNAFEIFIKTPSYDNQVNKVNSRLQALKIDIGKDVEILSLFNTFSELSTKIQLNKDGGIKNNPFFKSIISKHHLNRIPENLQKYKPFFETEYKIEWIDWKNKGYGYDDKGECPFCAEPLIPEYEQEKETFTSIYTKSNAKNIMELLGYFKALEVYIAPEKFKLLNDCIGSISDEIQIRTIIQQFMTDINHMREKIGEIINFDTHRITSEEITDLENKLTRLKINVDVLNMLRGNKTITIIGKINQKIDSVIKEINAVKQEIGSLKGLIQALADEAIKDINGFLETAGINYAMVMEVTSESDCKTLLKYKDRLNNIHEVDQIKKHLSWGERNAFALVLFLHYALSQNADLIILDDPISSFDTDKKYAIINRLFKNSGRKRSLYKETVLMITHDLEPIIDFIVINKPTGSYVNAYHLQNKNGILSEKKIVKEDMLSQIHILLSIVKDTSINEIYRLIALRKFIELTKTNFEEECAYNIISCILHAKQKPDKKIESGEFAELSGEEINSGTNLIISQIPTFSYERILQNLLTPGYLAATYKAETCNYFKLQLFRILLEIDKNKSKIQDDNLLKYIDSTYHTENNYQYNLDFRKFDTIPDFVIGKCDNFINENYPEA